MATFWCWRSRTCIAGLTIGAIAWSDDLGEADVVLSVGGHTRAMAALSRSKARFRSSAAGCWFQSQLLKCAAKVPHL
jgi:hypothetical protein